MDWNHYRTRQGSFCHTVVNHSFYNRQCLQIFYDFCKELYYNICHFMNEIHLEILYVIKGVTHQRYEQKDSWNQDSVEDMLMSKWTTNVSIVNLLIANGHILLAIVNGLMLEKVLV